MIGIVLNVAVILIFGALAAKIALGVRRELPIFREFNQPHSIMYLVLLFPLGPIVYLATVYRLGWLIAIVAAACCYLPGLIKSRKVLAAFDRAGTDRVRGARGVLTQAHGTAIGGLVYSCLMLLFTLLAVRGDLGA